MLWERHPKNQQKRNTVVEKTAVLKTDSMNVKPRQTFVMGKTTELMIDSNNMKLKKTLWGERHPSGYEDDIVYIAELTKKPKQCHRIVAC